jgi:hypothetical protein
MDGGTSLDDGTLHEPNQQTSSHSDRMIEKKRWILDWLSASLLGSGSTADVCPKANSESDRHGVEEGANVERWRGPR